MSDKEITETSGLLQHLLPGMILVTFQLKIGLANISHIGDIILADHGFTCDYAWMVMAEIKIPPFTQRKETIRKGQC